MSANQKNNKKEDMKDTKESETKDVEKTENKNKDTKSDEGNTTGTIGGFMDSFKLKEGKNIWISLFLVLVVVVLGVMVYEVSLTTYYNMNDVVGVVNSSPIYRSEISSDASRTIAAEEVLNVARERLLKEEMDNLGIAVPSDEDLDAKLPEYFGDITWAEAAENQGVSEEDLKNDIRFMIRLESYRAKVLGTEDMEAPEYPTEETTESVEAYNQAMAEYQQAMSGVEAKWYDVLNEVFSAGKIKIFSLAIN